MAGRVLSVEEQLVAAAASLDVALTRWRNVEALALKAQEEAERARCEASEALREVEQRREAFGVAVDAWAGARVAP